MSNTPALSIPACFRGRRNDKVFVFRGIPFAVLFVGTNGHVAVHGVAILKVGPNPLLEGT